jgi:hypothetical protein
VLLLYAMEPRASCTESAARHSVLPQEQCLRQGEVLDLAAARVSVRAPPWVPSPI